MTVGVAGAASGLRGSLRVPGDKSVAHRALLLASLAEGTTHVRGLPAGADVRSTRRCLEALGVLIRDEEGGVAVEGRAGTFAAPSRALDCGNSGTTMRLLAGILAARDLDVTLEGDESLRERPMRRIADPLRSMGAQIDLRENRAAPMRVRGSSSLRGISYDLPIPSAQLKSALLLAALGAHGTTTLGGALRSRDHTERMLPLFGAHLSATENTLVLDGPQFLRAPQAVLHVPGDISSASYWIAAAAVVPESRVTIEDVGLNPSRLGFIDVLQRMGASIEVHPRASNGAQHEGEPLGSVVVAGSPLRATTVHGAEVPALIDELPLLAVVAAFAEGTTTVVGAEELRVKESDRIEAVVRNGRAMGIEIDAFPDGFEVRGPATLRAAQIDAMGDHRIAMAFAIAGLCAPAGTRISGADSIEISYPEFFSTLESLRG